MRRPGAGIVDIATFPIDARGSQTHVGVPVAEAYGAWSNSPKTLA